MSKVRWTRGILVAVLAGGLVIGLALPAAGTLVSWSGNVQPGQVLMLTCPGDEFFWDGRASFYRREGGGGGGNGSPKAQVVKATATADGLGGAVTVPKNMYWVNWEIECVNTVQVQQNTGSSSDYVYFYCSPETPNITSVAWSSPLADVDGDFSTTNDQFLPPQFGTNGSLVWAGPVDPGVYVRAAFTCSA